jgi:hypothetical protein
MRGHGPPARGQRDSLSPRLATGPPRSEAGIPGGPWTPRSGAPVEQASTSRARDGVPSHREWDPAPAAATLAPTWHRSRRRQPDALTGRHRRETRGLTPLSGGHAWEPGTASPPAALCAVGTAWSRGQPQAVGEEAARRRPGQGCCPGAADVGPGACKGPGCVRGHEPPPRLIRPGWRPGQTSPGSRASARPSASTSGCPAPRHGGMSAQDARAQTCCARPGRPGGSRGVGCPTATGGTPPRASPGGARQRFGAMAKPPGGDAQGVPTGAARRRVRSGCPPTRRGRGRRSSARPWSRRGTPHGRPPPRASAQGVPAGRPARRAPAASHLAHRTGCRAIGRRVVTAAIRRRAARHCQRPRAVVGTGARGDGRGSGKRPRPLLLWQARPTGGAWHRGWRCSPGLGGPRPAPRSRRRPVPALRRVMAWSSTRLARSSHTARPPGSRGWRRAGCRGAAPTRTATSLRKGSSPAGLFGGLSAVRSGWEPAKPVKAPEAPNGAGASRGSHPPRRPSRRRWRRAGGAVAAVGPGPQRPCGAPSPPRAAGGPMLRAPGRVKPPSAAGISAPG